MVNCSELLPPTDTLMVCEVVKQEAGMSAVSSLELIKVVLTVQTLPKLTSAPELKPDPINVSVNAAEPVATLVGEMELSVKLPEVPEAEIVTYMVPEVPVEGSCTYTDTVPAITRLAGIAAYSKVEPSKLGAMAVPLKYTIELPVKFVPIIVRV
jgi:hypothetical protein